jgi:hypothetical protein
MAGLTQKPTTFGLSKDILISEVTRVKAIRLTQITSIDGARSMLDSFDFLGLDDVANEKDLAFALRQMVAEMAKIQVTRDLAKAAVAITYIWEENTHQRAGARIIEIINSKLQSITMTSEQLTQISNKAKSKTDHMEIKGKEIID